MAQTSFKTLRTEELGWKVRNLGSSQLCCSPVSSSPSSLCPRLEVRVATWPPHPASSVPYGSTPSGSDRSLASQIITENRQNLAKECLPGPEDPKSIAPNVTWVSMPRPVIHCTHSEKPQLKPKDFTKNRFWTFLVSTEIVESNLVFTCLAGFTSFLPS